jgi:hypothetical protein
VCPLAQRTQACLSWDRVFQQQSCGTWEHLLGHCTLFNDQGGDVNTVQFLPDGHHFGTGSDGVCCFFDTCMGHELQHYIDSMPPQGAIPMSSTAFSNSGCLLFVGYTNANCYAWDTFWPRYACYHFNVLEDLTLFFLVVLITLSWCLRAVIPVFFTLWLV